MAARIRLRRLGAKKRPTFRFVVTDSRMPRDGRFIEILGSYNPIEKPATVKILEEKMTHWLNQGAIPSDTVMSLLKQVGFLKKYETMKKGGDISGITISETITERKKKRKSKKEAKETKETKAEA
ncbi:MAG: 30S ribosomal protein S16 [candidate division Zixibacteria bacterium]|nr:30S ribosomal protein S16 [candidate division Zixibacteria bacterium]